MKSMILSIVLTLGSFSLTSFSFHATKIANHHYSVVLYSNPRCPYCKKVISYLDSQGKQIPIKDVTDPANRSELLKIGGKTQVPCLVIDGKALYESSDIIEWLKNHEGMY